MTPQDLTALWLTLKLALSTTLILLLLGTPIAWWLARSQWKGKAFIEAVVALPLVLPPTVLGFYLLISLGPRGPLGRFSQEVFGVPLAFSFAGILIGSIFYSLPFVVQPLQDAFAAINPRHLEVASTLGASPWDRFFTVAVPLARPGFLSAAVLTFSHTIGEFGVVLMIGGNIPGKTQVVSIAIYDHVEALEYGNAHYLSGLLVALSFFLLVSVHLINRRYKLTKP